MPIYMDRHNVEGATAKALADAHQKDLKLQDKYGIKLLTYWFDEGRGSAFCLIDAPAKEKVKQLHKEAHGSIPHKIMEVNPDTVEAFLGRIEDPQLPSDSLTPSGEALVDSAFLSESPFGQWQMIMIVLHPNGDPTDMKNMVSALAAKLT